MAQKKDDKRFGLIIVLIFFLLCLIGLIISDNFGDKGTDQVIRDLNNKVDCYKTLDREQCNLLFN